MLITTVDVLPQQVVAYVESAPLSFAAFDSAPLVTSVVPYFSQFKDITSTKWQKVGCGITSLAMIIDYYNPNAVTVNELLIAGLTAGAYQSSAGWIHSGLIKLSSTYGLEGSAHYLTNESSAQALAALSDAVQSGPVIASVHYTMDVTNPIPHMVVVTKIQDGQVYYNDPAGKSGGTHISTALFQKAWKQKYIVLRPVTHKAA